MNEPALLEVKDLSVRFGAGPGAVEAVKGASFTIDRGETLALVGKSGSGKSVTALSVLQLLPYPIASHPGGSIRFRGREMVGAPAGELLKVRGNNVSMIFQEPMTSLNPLHTIERQINEVLFLHKGLGREAARKRTLELLDQVGIADAAKRLDAYPHQLSGGQRQRVMIAMALANEPDLLIADEPTTALDVTIQAQILKLLKNLQARYGMALLFITHDLGIVRKMADRVCVMTRGEIVEHGLVDEVFDRPQHAYTRHLLSAEPRGRPAPGDPAAPVVMQADDIKVHFPIKRGVMRRTVDHVKAVDGVDLVIREGHTLGLVGESGSGKTTLGLALLRLERSEGAIRFEKHDLQALSQRALRPLRREMQIVFQDPFSSLSPRMSVSQIVGEGLEVHKIGSEAERRDLIERTLAEVGPRSLVARPLSARILRRPAPAHRHRPRPGAEAALHRARRADLGARHERAGADRRPAARPAGPPSAGLSLHQPRSQGRACAGRRGRGAAPRQGRRAWALATDLRDATRCLHPGPDRRRVQSRGDRRRQRRGQYLGRSRTPRLAQSFSQSGSASFFRNSACAASSAALTAKGRGARTGKAGEAAAAPDAAWISGARPRSRWRPPLSSR